MIYISHRGNVDGIYPEMENNPIYINKALNSGYDGEIEVWCISYFFCLFSEIFKVITIN